MAVRVGFLSVAHMHSWGYAPAFKNHKDSELVGVWDDEPARRSKFAESFGIVEHGSIGGLLNQVDAVVITSENKRHAELGIEAAKAGKHILCEKPLITTEEEGVALLRAVDEAGVKLMTAFPCRYSPAFLRLKERVQAGEMGAVKAICSTNRGRCPFGWFVEKDKSGGGAMIDHVVHVTDLLRVLLGEEVVSVQAQIGNNMYGEDWDDTAMLTLQFESGIFASLDSSWSRHKSYKTWGDVTMNVVCEKGVIELDMFNQALDVFKVGTITHSVAGFGSGLDDGLVDDFLHCILEDKQPPISGLDGLQASRVALAGYESAARKEVVALGI